MARLDLRKADPEDEYDGISTSGPTHGVVTKIWHFQHEG